ncbi:MAG TPA: carbohydrate ABC transporter permease [Ktedonobacterales bacterium]|nr:carbohydrate ABC transporter permease [Ktedonobacterales bacterium]
MAIPHRTAPSFSKRAIRRSGASKNIPLALSLVLGIVVTGLMLFPVYWMVANSFETSQQIFSIPVALVPTQLTFSSYATVWQTQLPHLETSLIVALGTALLSIAIATPAAYALAHFRLRITVLLVLVLLITQMIPTVSLTTPMFLIFNQFGLINSYPGLILADSTYAVPFAVLILRAFMLSLPYELTEAAFVDGAGEWGAFVRVMLPLAVPGVVTAGLFAFLFAWGDFIYALTLTTNDTIEPVSLSIYTYLGQFNNEWGGAMAVAALASVPAAILLVLFQRYITTGLTAGAVKG